MHKSDNIFYSPLAPINIPHVHITDYVFQNSQHRAQQAAIIDGHTGSTLAFSDLETRTRRLAGGLRAQGFNTGDVLALVAPNCPDYAVVFYATALCGGTVTTVNPSHGIAEIRQQLADSNASWIVSDRCCMVVVKQAMRSTRATQLICLQQDSHAPCIDSFLGECIEQVNVDIHTHPVVIPYSSGTTGLPKGVMLSHHNLVANIEQINTTVKYETDEIALAALPFFHIYGMQVLLGSFLAGGNTLITMPRFNMEQALALIQQHSITQLFVVPPIVLGLAKSPLVDQFDLSSLRKVFSGAAPLGAKLASEAAKRIDCAVVQGYGMTELSPVSHITPGYDSKPGSSGVTVPNSQSRIVDSDGHNLPPGAKGELLVKGPQVMIGYLSNDQATRDTLDEDGWLHTGDLAVIDTDGYMTIVDRVKELIKYKGFQVAPAELEALIITHPDVADVAVIGLPDDECGEIPKAFIVAHPDLAHQSKDQFGTKAVEIMSYVADQVATYKCVHEVQWVKSIPKSASGKILRRTLRDGIALEAT